MAINVKFLPGDEVEFWSVDRGGTWKPGIISGTAAGGGSTMVRIHVGNNVHIMRRPETVRRVKVGLPIEVVKGTNPPEFRWEQVVNDLEGNRRRVTYSGRLPVTVEGAVCELVDHARALEVDNARLREQLASMAERVAAQSDVLSRKAEKRTK